MVPSGLMIDMLLWWDLWCRSSKKPRKEKSLMGFFLEEFWRLILGSWMVWYEAGGDGSGRSFCREAKTRSLSLRQRGHTPINSTGWMLQDDVKLWFCPFMAFLKVREVKKLKTVLVYKLDLAYLLKTVRSTICVWNIFSFMSCHYRWNYFEDIIWFWNLLIRNVIMIG